MVMHSFETMTYQRFLPDLALVLAKAQGLTFDDLVVGFHGVAQKECLEKGMPFVGRIMTVHSEELGGFAFVADMLATKEQADEYGEVMILHLQGKAELVMDTQIGEVE